MVKKVLWLLALALVCFGAGVVVASIHGDGTKADLNRRADEYLAKLTITEAKVATLATELAGLKADAIRLADSARGAQSTGVRLGFQIDSSLGYLDGATDELDRVEAIVRRVQNRSSIQDSTVGK